MTGKHWNQTRLASLYVQVLRMQTQLAEVRAELAARDGASAAAAAASASDGQRPAAAPAGQWAA